MKMDKVAFWRQAVEEQVKWIEEHGGCRAGYVKRYGDVNDPDRCGNGGEAIYQADVNWLEELTQNLNKAIWKGN